MDLDGKTALILGSSEIASALVQEFTARGAKVLIADQNAERAKQIALENTAYFGEVDLSSNSSVAMLAYDLADKIGELDILANASATNIGAIQGDGDFDAMLQAMIKSNFLTFKHFLPEMRARETGILINLVAPVRPDDIWSAAGQAFVETAMDRAGVSVAQGSPRFRLITVTPGDTPARVATETCNLCADHAQ